MHNDVRGANGFSLSERTAFNKRLPGSNGVEISDSYAAV